MTQFVEEYFSIKINIYNMLTHYYLKIYVLKYIIFILFVCL